jgi:hypothetical protein
MHLPDTQCCSPYVRFDDTGIAPASKVSVPPSGTSSLHLLVPGKLVGNIAIPTEGYLHL